MHQPDTICSLTNRNTCYYDHFPKRGLVNLSEIINKASSVIASVADGKAYLVGMTLTFNWQFSIFVVDNSIFC